jgi:predicted helicase
MTIFIFMNEEFAKNYLNRVIETYKSGHATEHSYRPALQELFTKVTNLTVHNEPKRSEFGAPDFVFVNKKIIVAYAEAKDINVSLDDIEKSEQMVRYYGYTNIILTNSLEFRFYKSGQKSYEPIRIAELKSGEISGIEENFKLLEDSIRDFITEANEPIKSGSVLAKVMAGKARRIRDNIKSFLSIDNDQKNESLLAVYNVIKQQLLADMDFNKFADMYAQTVVYGLFVARYHDDSIDTFTRQEARDLVPASNPFLRNFFDHIAGSSFDVRIKFIVDELCEEFVHADVRAIVHDYYKVDKDSSRDPIIHFYEDFLQEYDSAERKKMGVFYTPLPVVQFIVRSIDDILKTEFDLPQGLADTSKIEINRVIQGKKVKEPIHKIQILDPATGTGTFLNETILHIKKSFTGQEGRWSNYAVNDLLPRLHGFELMMASYTIAHLKLSTTLKESGADIDKARLGVYLTNTLEETKTFDDSLFAGLGLDKAITEESRLANKVKKDLPIMVILGNPPYSGVSSNETKHANSLVEKYKIEPGGIQKLQERKHWLNDDYVKFIAFAEDLIAKNGEGVLGFITNHGYLDNPTFRGMRWHLMNTFDSIFVIDLHGNSKKKEVSPDGSKDENVFNIQQGVALMLAVKKNQKIKNNLANIYHLDVYGKRENKFDYLNSLLFEKINWQKLESRLPNLVFVPEGANEVNAEYQMGFSVNDLFLKGATGIVTMGDNFIIDDNKDALQKRIMDFLNSETSESVLKEKYDLGKNYAGWIIGNKSKIEFDSKKIVPLTYRPFDNRYTYFDGKLVWRLRDKIMNNFLDKDNIGLVAKRGFVENNAAPVFISNKIIESRSWSRPGMQGIESSFPLYLYSEDGAKISNLKKEIVKEIEKQVGEVTPRDILDYVYAVLHSPNYREKYKEFLKIDFPRVPYPQDKKLFVRLVAFGRELRELHLLESPKVNNFITTYSESGSDIVEKKYLKFKDDKVYINESQCFGSVPEVAWNFYIGGYQPAQKWLKDRQGRKLSNSDIEHYQKMIVALFETDRIMKEIDKIC